MEWPVAILAILSDLFYKPKPSEAFLALYDHHRPFSTRIWQCCTLGHYQEDRLKGRDMTSSFLFEVFVVGDTGTLAICWQWNREEVEGPLLILITDQTFNRHYVLATAQLKYIFILPFPQYITNPYCNWLLWNLWRFTNIVCSKWYV